MMHADERLRCCVLAVKLDGFRVFPRVVGRYLLHRTEASKRRGVEHCGTTLALLILLFVDPSGLQSAGPVLARSSAPALS